MVLAIRRKYSPTSWLTIVLSTMFVLVAQPIYSLITIQVTSALAPTPPLVPANLRLNGSEACGYSTNVNYIIPTWDAVADAVSYNYKVELPNSTVYGPTNVGNVTNVSGAFGGEGTSKFSVQAVAANGLTSDWAPMCAVTYGKTAPAMPLHETPVDGTVQNSNDFWFEWNDVDGAMSYEMQNSTNPAIDSQGSFQNVMWTGDYQQVQPTESRARSVGANGTWYWQVRAVDGAGNKSTWTTPWGVTIDNDVPGAPVLGAAGLISGGVTNQSSITATWNKPSGDTVKYEYEYWNDIAGNPYKESTPWRTDVLGESRTGDFTEGEGTHYLRVRAVDQADNESNWSNIFVIVYDKTPPETAISASTSSGNSLGFAGTVADPHLNYYYCYLTTNQAITIGTAIYAPGQEVGVRSADCVTKWASGQTNFDGELGGFDIAGLPAGSYTINLVAYDLAGNSNVATPVQFVVVITEPEREVIPTNPNANLSESPASPTPSTDSTSTQPLTLNVPGFAATVPGNIDNDNSAPQDSSSTSDNNSSVLGEQDDESETPLADTGEVLGLMDNKFFGIAWYWYLVILVALVGGWLLIAAAIRRNRVEE